MLVKKRICKRNVKNEKSGKDFAGRLCLMQRLFDGTEEERMQARGQNRFESEFADGLRFADHQGPQKKKGTRAKSLLTFTLADF